jgi:hypothetical protein
MTLRAGADGQVLDFWYARWVVVWPGGGKAILSGCAPRQAGKVMTGGK